MLDEGVFKYDVFNTIFNIKDLLYDKYGEEFKNLIVEERLMENREGYPMLVDPVFESIKKKVINTLIKKEKKLINGLINDGLEEDQISKIFNSKYFSAYEILSYIDKYKKENRIITPEKKTFYLNIGFLKIALAFVGIYFLDINNYKLIILGIIMVILGLPNNNRPLYK